MISVKINDFEYLIKPRISIVEACKFIGIKLPRFCYHELLSVAGNCRICLVELENGEKPVPSCVTEVQHEMSIYTNTPFVRKARQNVLETLLLNHPLDCPVCDQAGECDLQDLTRKHGNGYSRHFFKKKTVEDKYCGPLIRTVMTRCIACTRCVRFSSEIAGMDFYGSLTRGGHNEIGSFVPNFFSSEISANAIDLCPVGALTSNFHVSKARPWELKITESIDITDSLNSNVYIHSRGTEIHRILPKAKEGLNFRLISDKARYSYDANNVNRLTTVSGRSSVDQNKKVKIGWKKFLARFDKIIGSNKISFIIDDGLDLESLITLAKLEILAPNSIAIKTPTFTNKNGNFYSNMNYHFFNIVNHIDGCIILLAANPKIENTILNAKILTKLKKKPIKVYSCGFIFESNFQTNFINLSPTCIFNSLDGKTIALTKSIRNSTFSLVLLGDSFKEKISNITNIRNFITKNLPFTQVIYYGLKGNTESLNLLKFKQPTLADKKFDNSINFFVKSDFGFGKTSRDKSLENIFFKKNRSLNIWFHTHSTNYSDLADYVLPAATHFEKKLTYVNLEHRAQQTGSSLQISKACKDFASVIFSCFNFSENLINSMFTGRFKYLFDMAKNPLLYDIRYKSKTVITKKLKTSILTLFSDNKIKVSKYPFFAQKISNFYITDTFTKNSKIMNTASNEFFMTYNYFNYLTSITKRLPSN